MNKVELAQKGLYIQNKLKRRIITLLITLAIALLFQAIIKNKTSKKDIAENKYKCENYIAIDASLTDNYDQLTISRRTRKLNVNTFHYIYEVDGVSYEADKISASKLPNETSIKVWYDKADPTKNEKKDPCIFYNNIKDRKVFPLYNFFFYSSLIAFLVSVYCFFSIIYNVGRLIFNSLEKGASK
jgi:hypothetical protein